MTEQTSEPVQNTSRLDVLKDRARLMGIEFSNNIGEETLAKRIQDKLNDIEPGSEAFDESQEAEDLADAPDAPEVVQAPAPTVSDLNPLAGDRAGEKPAKQLSVRERLRRENLRLIRCRITNLDPKKANLPGEVLTTGNEIIGTVKKFVPFGEVTDDGFHLEYCLLKMLQRRRFLDIKTVRDPRTGTNRVQQRWVREFAIDILEPLTKEEIADLANAQAAAGVFAPGSE